jgi:predicted GTPase
MSAENQESHSSGDSLPFRDGALSPAKIRDQCPQFRILIIGKANAGKTTTLRKVCNAERNAKPIIYDAEGEKVNVKRDLADVLVCHANLVSGQTT